MSLEPFDVQDARTVAEMYGWATSPASGFRWRLGGVMPNLADFTATLAQNRGTIEMVARRSPEGDELRGGLVAHMSLYGHVERDRVAYFSCIGADSCQRTVQSFESVYLFLVHAMSTLNLRKVYFEFPEFNLEQFSSAVSRGLLTIEVVLRAHTYHAGDYHDHLVCAIYRENAVAYVQRIRGHFDWPDLK